MKLQAQNSPHIRSRDSNQTVMNDVIVATLPLYAMAVFYYGVRALFLGVVSVTTCLLAGLVCNLLARRVPCIRDQSGIVTGLLLPLLMPASIRWEILAAAALFAIAVAKHPFGGVGQNIFNPAAAGTAFAMVCWPKALFSYPVPFDHLPLVVDDTVRLAVSPARALMLGGTPTTDSLDLLLGNYSGPMGATHILVLLACLLFLTVRRTASLPMSLSFLGGTALVAALFPRAMVSPLYSVVYELSSGLMLLGAVYLLNDPVTSPKRKLPKLLYGFLTGVVCMAFRHLGSFEESLPFALLIMNATVWMIDLWGEYLARTLRRKQSGTKQNQDLSAASSDDLGGSEG